MLVVAGCDGTVMLDPVEEPLDFIAEFVDTRAEGGRVDAMVERANVRISAAFSDLGADGRLRQSIPCGTQR